MNAAELMDKVFDIYKKSFWNQVAFAAIISIVNIGVIFIATTVLMVAFLALVATGLSLPSPADDVPGMLLLGVVIIILPFALIWQVFSALGHILLSRQAFYGYRTSIADMGIFKVFFRVLSVVFALLFVAIPFVAVAFGFIMAFVAFPGGLAFSGVGIVFLLALGFGYLLLANMFSLSIAVAAFERRYFFGALMRSWQLVKPNFWRVFGVRTAWMFSIFAFSFSAQGIFTLLGMLITLVAGTAPIGVLFSFFGIIFTSFIGPMVAAMLVAPLDGIMQSLLYFNQRMKHEGFDLELRLEKL